MYTLNRYGGNTGGIGRRKGPHLQAPRQAFRQAVTLLKKESDEMKNEWTSGPRPRGLTCFARFSEFSRNAITKSRRQ